MIDYKDPKYTSTERANALLSLMTNEEKVGSICLLVENCFSYWCFYNFVCGVNCCYKYISN